MKPPDFLLLLSFLQFSAALAFGLSSDVTEQHHVAENNTDQHPDLSLAARVFSGNEAKAGVWPWQGVLVDVSTRGWPGLCGCVLISDQWVLTTARCVTKYTAKPKRLLLKFGTIFSRRPNGLGPIPNKQLRWAVKIILHPEWNATNGNNDLAAVRLRRRVVLNKFVKPVALPSGNESLTDGSVCNITGWGKGSSTSLMLRLHQAQVPVLNNSDCKLWIARAAEPAGDYVLSDNHLCTGSYDIYDELENGCNGDNGGPLVRKKPVKYDPCNPNSISSDTPDDYELYGIFSAAVGTCGEAFSPAIYTRVQSYKSWILDSTGGLGMNEAVRAGRIVGGQNAVSIKQWPWQGYLYYSRTATELYYRDGEQFCGCSLIHKQWAITAAHCFFAKRLYKFIKVAFGKTSSDNLHVDTEQLREIAEVKKHKEYSQFKTNFEYDIAMVKLKNPVDITDNVRPVRLPEAGMEIAAWTVVNITGYGHTSYNGNSSIVLKQAQVPIVSRENCLEKYKSLEIQILETQLCAGYEEGGTDTCQGDSGGPLVWKAGRDVPEKCNDDPEGLETDDYVLAGIASYGEECAKPGFPGVYTRVSSYIEWINQQMSEGASRIGPDSAAEDVTRSDDKHSSAVRGGVDVVIIFVVTIFSILLVTLY